MKDIIRRAKTWGFEIKGRPTKCSYCNTVAEYTLCTGAFHFSLRLLCEKHKLEFLKKFDE